MSVQATSWVWTHSQADGTARLVALALADAANAQGERSCQSVSTIASMVRASERTVQRALRALEDAGEIEATGKDRHYQTTVYRFPGMAVAAGGDTHAAGGDIQGEQMALGVTTGVAGGDTAMSPNPNNPTTTNPSNPEAAPADADAREVVEWWWESLNIKPAGKGAYFSAVATVKALLHAGHTKRDVAKALQRCGSPVSIPRMEIELRRSGGGATVPVDDFAGRTAW